MNPSRSSLRLLAFSTLAAGLSAAPARFGGTTPVLTLNPGETRILEASALGLLPPVPLPRVTNAPAGVEVRVEGSRLELTATTPFGWQVLETEAGDLLLRSGSRVGAEIRYRGEPGLSVDVFGSFNGWSRGADLLAEVEPGVYTKRLMLEPGDYEYLLRIGEREFLDPANPDSVGNGMGGFNSPLRLRAPADGVITVRRLGWTVADGRRTVRFLAGDREPDTRVVALHGNRRVAPDAIRWTGDTLSVHLTAADGDGPLRLALAGQGRSSALQTVFLDEGFSWEDGLVYALMPDRFRDGDPANNRPVSHPELDERANWQGGDLAGILRTLREGYFEALGVNTLWIYPLNKAADGAWREYPEPHRMYTGYHGYWPVSSTGIEPRFGDEALLRQVVNEAHRRGIRVLLDFVSNHVHKDHPWVTQHPDWFSSLELPDGRLNLRIWDEHRLTTWFEPYMPDIAYDRSPEAVKASCDAALWWLKTFDLDGFRHDAVKHVPREFWQELTRRIRTDPALQDRPIYQIGETFGSDELILSYVGPDVLDAQFNFNLFHPVRALFLDERRPFGELADLMEQNLRVYGRNNRMGTLIDSHDKARFAVYADGDIPLEGVSETEAGWATRFEVDDPATWDKQALFLCQVLTSPGIPFLYYGDEIGMTGAGDPDNRRMMRFEPDLKDGERRLKERVELYCRARRERPELRRGDLEFLLADSDVVAYLRSAETPVGRSSRSLVWLNRSGELQSRTVTLPLGLGTRTVDLQPWEGAIQIIE